MRVLIEAFGTVTSLPVASVSRTASPCSRTFAPSERLAVVRLDDRLAEAGIDVAVRVEDVLDQPLRAACGDAVEIRTDVAARVAEAVADRAALLKDCAPSWRRVSRLCAEELRAFGDHLVEPRVFGREVFGQAPPRGRAAAFGRERGRRRRLC